MELLRAAQQEMTSWLCSPVYRTLLQLPHQKSMDDAYFYADVREYLSRLKGSISLTYLLYFNQRHGQTLFLCRSRHIEAIVRLRQQSKEALLISIRLVNSLLSITPRQQMIKRPFDYEVGYAITCSPASFVTASSVTRTRLS